MVYLKLCFVFMHYKLYIILCCYIVSFLFFSSPILSVQISTIGRNTIYCLKNPQQQQCSGLAAHAYCCVPAVGVLLCAVGWGYCGCVARCAVTYFTTADYACCGAVVWCGQGVLSISPQWSHIHCAVVNPAVVRHSTPPLSNINGPCCVSPLSSYYYL